MKHGPLRRAGIGSLIRPILASPPDAILAVERQSPVVIQPGPRPGPDPHDKCAAPRKSRASLEKIVLGTPGCAAYAENCA